MGEAVQKFEALFARALEGRDGAAAAAAAAGDGAPGAAASAGGSAGVGASRVATIRSLGAPGTDKADFPSGAGGGGSPYGPASQSLHRPGAADEWRKDNLYTQNVEEVS